jgi:hypothetical protein
MNTKKETYENEAQKKKGVEKINGLQTYARERVGY